MTFGSVAARVARLTWAAGVIVMAHLGRYAAALMVAGYAAASSSGGGPAPHGLRRRTEQEHTGPVQWVPAWPGPVTSADDRVVPMDGIHDLGGMQGFGAVDHLPAEPPFPGRWEAAARALMMIVSGAVASRVAGAGPDVDEPRFGPGDRVRVHGWHPPGHTRCPGYVRGTTGTVVRVDGTHSVPDIEAHGTARRYEPTYAVRFDAADLWQDGQHGVSVHVDLWDSYLEPA